GKDGTVLQNFMAYNIAFAGGVYVASGDVNADGKADIITGAGAGGGPNVTVFSGADLSVLQDFMTYPTAFAGRVRVGYAQLAARPARLPGAGLGGGSEVRMLGGASLQDLDRFLAYGPDFSGGVFVGGA